MTERRAPTFWLQNDGSANGLFQGMEQPSRYAPRIVEESLSMFPRQEESRNNTLNFFNLENTIGFDQAKRTFHGQAVPEPILESPQVKSEVKAEVKTTAKFDVKMQEENFSEQIQLEVPEDGQKKGLRFLSKLVY